MDVITFEKNAYLTLIKKIDEIYNELQRLQDPAYNFSKEYIDSYAVLEIDWVSNVAELNRPRMKETRLYLPSARNTNKSYRRF